MLTQGKSFDSNDIYDILWKQNRYNNEVHAAPFDAKIWLLFTAENWFKTAGLYKR